MKKKAYFNYFTLIIICMILTQKVNSFTVWNGCPDFMKIDGSYVEGFTGTFDDPFTTPFITENRHTLNTKLGTYDANTGNALATIPTGEIQSIRLGNDEIGGEAEAIVYHFTVDSLNSLLFVNFAVVLQDPGHDKIFQPRFVVRITDAEGNLVSDCSEYDVSAAAGLDGFKDYTGGYTTIRWRDWTKVGLDLTPFAGKEVQVQFITYDCALMGHFGYAYFTAHCAPNKLEIKECQGSQYTVSAPDGFASYLWDNGDTTRTTTRQFSSEDAHLFCEVTSVTGCSFTQSAFVSSNDSEKETFFVDTICQGEPYNKHQYNLPPQQNVGTSLYSNVIFDPTLCSEQKETKLQLTVLKQFYEIEASICEGDDYIANGFSIIQPPVGILFDTLQFFQPQKSCDSVVCLKLTISESLNLSHQLMGDITPCTGEATTYYVESTSSAANFSWSLPDNAVLMNGSNSPQIVVYFTDDQPGSIILKGENGCGTNAIPLEVHPRMSYHLFIKDTACINQPFTKYNFDLPKFQETGYFTYTQNLQSSKGCDSTVVLALTVAAEPKAMIETDGDPSFLCSSNRVMLKASGEGGSYILHTCDSLPVSVGDIYCTDGTIETLSYVLNHPEKKAEGVVFYLDTAYQYVLVTALKDEQKNAVWSTEYYDIPGLVNHSHLREILTDFDGYANTAILRNTGNAILYPAAWSVDFENGWYIPSIGQMRVLFSKFHEINPSIAAVGGEEFPTNQNRMKNPYSYLSSTELSEYYYCSQTYFGEIRGNFKNSTYGNLRAIKTVRLNLLSKPLLKIGDLVENEYGEKGIAFQLSEDGRSGWMVSLNETYRYFQWDSKAQDIPSIPNHYDSIYYAQPSAAMEDWNAVENTKAMQTYIQQDEKMAAWDCDLSKGWCLPTAGQMDEIYGLLPIIDSALVHNNGEIIYYEPYWTSTEIDSFYAWTYDMSYGNPDPYPKDSTFAVRRVAPFTYCTPYAEVLDSTLSFQWQSGEQTPYLEVIPTETSTYSVTATNKEGCFVSVSKTLFVSQAENIDIYDTICYGETYKDDYFEETKSGVYTKTIKNGTCNQTITLHLTADDFTQRTILTENVCFGMTYHKNGFFISANAEGIHTDSVRLTNRLGCDSIVVLHLNVLPMTNDTVRHRICQNESFEWNGIVVPAYKPTGIHYFETTSVDNLSNCQSHHVLELQIDTIYQRSMVDSICQFEVYHKNGFNFTAQQDGYQHVYQTLSSATGCDSILALNLKVFTSHETTFTDTVILGETYASKDFQLPEQTSIGWHQYEKHLTNITGCDSLLLLNLYVISDEDVITIPTAFTPRDQNGENDTFMPGYEVYIYDRYGLLVCHSLTGWDGTYRGELADPGVYIYTLYYKTGKEKHGTVEILKE